MSDRLNFKGFQETQKGNVSLEGHLGLLPREWEFSVGIKGRMTIYDGKDFTHDFDGRITQLTFTAPPKIEIYTSGNLGEKLYYRLDKPKSRGDLLTYSGIWCPINEETLPMIATPLGTPKSAKHAELEFIIKNSYDKYQLKQLGLLE